MKKYLGILLVLLFASPLILCAEEPWKLVKDAEGIKVYSRPVPNAGYSEFMGIGEIKAPLEVVSRVFEDIPSFPQWFGFCNEARQLKHDTADTWLLYIVINTPGPVTDRDVIVDAVRDKKPDKITIALKSVKEDLVPNGGKYVRITELTGSSVMTKKDEDTTNIVYTLKPNPAGYIPGWISNMVQKNQPFLTIKGMREMVKRDIYYQQAGISRKK